jgi:hypothetical protein
MMSARPVLAAAIRPAKIRSAFQGGALYQNKIVGRDFDVIPGRVEDMGISNQFKNFQIRVSFSKHLIGILFDQLTALWDIKFGQVAPVFAVLEFTAGIRKGGHDPGGRHQKESDAEHRDRHPHNRKFKQTNGTLAGMTG